MVGNMIDDLLRLIKSVAAQQEAGLGQFLSKPRTFFRLLSQSSLRLLGGDRASAGVPLADEQEQRQAKANHQRQNHSTHPGKNSFVPPDQLLESIEAAGGTGEDRFTTQMTLNVHR